MKTLEYLKNYAEDLEYNIRGNDIFSINHSTCGTPEFKSESEAQQYLDELRKTIAQLERLEEWRASDGRHTNFR